MPASALPRDLSLALGTGGTSPWQLGEAFTGFASGGYAVNRYFIDRIFNAAGEVVYVAEPVTVCDLCEERWFDGRETATEELLPEFARLGPEDASLDDRPEETLEKVEEIILTIGDPEVPEYSSAEEMIELAGNWHPDYTETPEFWSDRNQALRIITPQNAYIVYDMMRDVIRQGTGRRARELGRRDLGGKTGTSNNRRDAWFSGFNSEIVGVAWVGFDDDSRSLGAGEAGGATALPMWKDFMATALDRAAEAPLQQPDGLVSVRISKQTGLLAPFGSNNTMFEIFRTGNAPVADSNQLEFNEDNVFVDDGGDESIF
jgi:penicillin-binding protein 1A